MSRKRHATTGLVVLALLLGSLWASGSAAPAAGNAGGQLASSASLPGIGPAALPDRIPALRPSAERPDAGGRLLPLLGGLLAASLTVASGVPARRRRSSLAPARPPVLSAPRGPRAPPRLQPA
ncbi:MAG TPA: hypothetical protein VHS79_16395 [Actinomycetes bacterium]|nr:hypothetical protein [Actinomycetes bacterium]